MPHEVEAGDLRGSDTALPGLPAPCEVGHKQTDYQIEWWVLGGSRNWAEEAISWVRGNREGFTEEVPCMGRPFHQEGPDGHQKFADVNCWGHGVEVPRQSL